MVRGRSIKAFPGPAHAVGFSLIEITVVVLVIAVLAAIVLPRFSQAQENTKVGAAASDLRQIANAMQRYHARHGDYPPDTFRGVFPPELASDLVEFDLWNTPIGGAWDWDYWPNGVYAFKACVTIVDGDPALYQQLDELIDDGELTTGQLQRINQYGNRLQFGIEHH
ncbi:MAG: prepilin-type N-terminal cleavage/methylation domain-containing protein [Planctomycetota bacterium]